jgi:hypothetical protein
MADQILFDRLAYIDKLKSAGIDEAQARAHGEALDAALRESVATKHDIEAVKNDIQAVRHDLQLAVRDMTIRTGAMLIVLGGFLASIKFFG